MESFKSMYGQRIREELGGCDSSDENCEEGGKCPKGKKNKCFTDYQAKKRDIFKAKHLAQGEYKNKCIGNQRRYCVGGKGKIPCEKQKSEWMKFLCEFREDHPEIKGKEVMKQASVAYKAREPEEEEEVPKTKLSHLKKIEKLFAEEEEIDKTKKERGAKARERICNKLEDLRREYEEPCAEYESVIPHAEKLKLLLAEKRKQVNNLSKLIKQHEMESMELKPKCEKLKKYKNKYEEKCQASRLATVQKLFPKAEDLLRKSKSTLRDAEAPQAIQQQLPPPPQIEKLTSVVAKEEAKKEQALGEVIDEVKLKVETGEITKEEAKEVVKEVAQEMQQGKGIIGGIRHFKRRMKGMGICY